MKREDDRILEFLDREGWASPRHVATAAFRQVSADHVRERLYLLWYAGLVNRFARGHWELTTWGRLYLEGRLNAGDLRTPRISILQERQRNGPS